MDYKVLVAVNHSLKQFAVSSRRSDQHNKMSLFRRKFERDGFEVAVYATDLPSNIANNVRDGHKFMYQEAGYLQRKAS